MLDVVIELEQNGLRIHVINLDQTERCAQDSHGHPILMHHEAAFFRDIQHGKDDGQTHRIGAIRFACGYFRPPLTKQCRIARCVDNLVRQLNELLASTHRHGAEFFIELAVMNTAINFQQTLEIALMHSSAGVQYRNSISAGSLLHRSLDKTVQRRGVFDQSTLNCRLQPMRKSKSPRRQGGVAKLQRLHPVQQRHVRHVAGRGVALIFLYCNIHIQTNQSMPMTMAATIVLVAAFIMRV